MSQFLEGLSAEVTVNYNNYGSFFENQDRSFAYESLNLVRNQKGEILDTTATSLGEATDLAYSSGFSNKRQFTHLRGELNYTKSIGAHTIEATGMFRQSSRAFDGRDAVNHRRNFFGNVHAGIANKYFIDVSASYGGNNRVPADGGRYELYPAVSASWMLSREGFMQDVGVLDRLQLQASWGIVGSDELPTRNPWESYYDSGQGYRFTNDNNYWQGFAEQRAASIDFGVEKSQKTNVGLDADFLDSRLQLSTDVFYTRTTNILADGFGRYSAVLGVFPPQNTNGIVENRGMEASLRWQDQGESWSYHIGGRFSFTRNEIVEQNEVFRQEDYLRRTGEPVGQRFGLEMIGFFQDEQEIANSPAQNFGEVKPGDIRYKDQNGDGVIDELDEVPMGYSSDYPEMYFSSSVGASYKGVSVSALFQGTANYTAYLNTPGVFRPMRNNNTISTHYYNRRWTPATSASATYPRLSTEENSNNFRPNSLWLTDRSFVKLRSLKISYSLPSALVESMKLNGLQVVVRGQNLFSIDDIPVLDPEHLTSSYPLLRSYSAGIEVQL
jgi:TonB-linked SusC/RagA family outer membrane protein